MSDNATLFDAGMAKASQIIYGHLYDILMNVCEAAVVYAMNNHQGFMNFTGNTHTGYGCAVYLDGNIEGMVLAIEKDKPPVRVKLAAGETAFLDPDYDGRTRKFTGVIETDRGLGYEYAMRFLESHKPKHSKGIEFCMTTGTEYSEYLEAVYHADVLTGTFTEIPQLLYQSLKPLR